MTPDTPTSSPRLASFTAGDWLVEPKSCHVSRGHVVVKVRPQLVDLLLCLARRQGHIVLKDEILAEVWPGQFIAESGLSRCVAELRQVLQDDAQQPRFIETIPKRGYRLIAPVVWVEEEPPAGPPVGRAAPSGGLADSPSATVVTPLVAGHPLGRSRRFWTGVGLAVFVLVIVATAILTTRSPARVLGERDTVLLADVSNATGDRVFDDTVRLALAVNLEQAPFLRILPQEAVRSALLRARRPPDERVVGAIALEVCRREGGAVLLAGSIASLGSRYVIGIEAIACGTGESIGRAMSEAGSKEGVLTALEQAASRIRRRLGESRDSLRQFDVPLARATTPSFDALVALTRGDVSRDRGQYEEALTHYRRATELDPQFALAWARRGVAARNIGLRDEAIPALRRAFALEERLTQPERFYIQSAYYRLVEGDPEKAIEIHRVWKRMYPGSAVPPNAIASVLCDEMGQYDAAVAEAREAVRLAPGTSAPYSNLVQALVGAGRFAEAKQALAEATGRGLDDFSMHAYSLNVAEIEGDRAAIERETGWGLNNDATSLLWLRMRAGVAAEKGRLVEARRLWQQALDRVGKGKGARDLAGVHLDRAEAEAVAGSPDTARVALDSALDASDKESTILVRAAIVLALLADTARARAVLDEARRLASADPAPLRVWLPVAEALVVAREGRAEEALRILQPVARFERGADFVTVPLIVRGLAAASAHRPVDAAAAFGEVLRLRPLSGGPWVVLARLGSARALGDSGDRTASLAAYDAFLESWKDADREAPLLKVAERERRAMAARH